MGYEVLKLGKSVWYSRLSFTSSGATFCSTKPELYTVKELDTRRGIAFLENNRGKTIQICQGYLTYSERISETKEEAIEKWNMQVRDELDRVQSEYEDQIRKIKKKLEKI